MHEKEKKYEKNTCNPWGCTHTHTHTHTRGIR